MKSAGRTMGFYLITLLTPLAAQAHNIEQERHQLTFEEEGRAQSSDGSGVETAVTRRSGSLALFAIGVVALIAARRNKREAIAPPGTV